jgi:hypothetical protein
MSTIFFNWHQRINSTDVPKQPGFYPVIRLTSEDNPEDLSLIIQVFNGFFWCNYDGTKISEANDKCLLAWGPVMTYRDARLASFRTSEALRGH